MKKKEEYRVSKFLTVDFLVTPGEMRGLLESLGELYIFPAGELLSKPEPISHSEWLAEYAGHVLEKKKLRTCFFTYDKEAVYLFEAKPNQYLFYPRQPVMQVREHQFITTSDNRIQSMVFGAHATPWGIQIAYPQIFADPVTKKIAMVFQERERPNTAGFRKIQKWARVATKPASFVLGGKMVKAKFRVGKEWMCVTS